MAALKAYALRLEIDATRPIPDDIVESVVQHSTAREAIETGLWTWFAEHYGLDDDDMFDMSLVFMGEEDPEMNEQLEPVEEGLEAAMSTAILNLPHHFASNIYPGAICGGPHGCGDTWEQHPEAVIIQAASLDELRLITGEEEA